MPKLAAGALEVNLHFLISRQRFAEFRPGPHAFALPEGIEDLKYNSMIFWFDMASRMPDKGGAVASSFDAEPSTMSPPAPPSLFAILKRCPIHIITLLLLCCVLVLPSAFVNKFFMLDVGGILAQGAEFPKNLHSILSPYNGSGRYYPLYWFYHVLLYSIFRFDVRGYFLIQIAGFFCASVLLTKLFARMFGARAAALFSVLLLLSSPNAEILYTMGKAEPLLYLFCSTVLFLFYYGRVTSLRRYLAIAVVFTFGLWSKETAIVLLAFCAAGIIVAQLVSLRNGLGGSGKAARLRFIYLMFSLGLGGIISRFPYLIYANDGGSSEKAYMNYSLTWHLVGENIVFYLTQQPDVVGFGILATLFLTLILKRVIWRESCTLNENGVFDFIFAASLLVMAWSYMAILFVFRWGMGYYGFVPAIIFRFVAGYGFLVLFQKNIYRRRFFVSSCLSMLLLLAYATAYLWYVGSSQVIYSRVYTRALHEYLNLSQKGDSLIFESYAFYSEQVGNTKALFSTVFHQQRRVYGIADIIDPAVVTPAMRSLLAVSANSLLANENNIPKKDDYVLAMTGDKLATWQIRGVAPFYSEGSVLQADGEYDMRLLGDEKVFSPGLFVNTWTHWLTARSTYIGYKLYKVLSGPRFIWFGRYPDGWVGKQARLALYPEYVASAKVHISTSKYNPHNSVVLFKDGVAVERALLSTGQVHTFNLNTGSKGTPTVFQFEIKDTFVPKKFHLNNDSRELGATVRLEPFAPERQPK